MRISNLLKSLVLSASLALGLASAANATPWTVTFSGVSDSGYSFASSYTNYTDLSGQAYSLSVTLDPAAYQIQYADNYPGYYSYAGGFGSLSGTANISLNVGSFSKSYTLDLSQSNYGQAELFNYDPSYYNYGQTYQYQQGYTAGGQSVSAYAYLYSFINAVNAGLDFNQVFTSTGSGDYGRVEFYSSGSDGYSSLYDSNPTTVTINGGGNVPEPMSLSLVALGLLGAAVTRRKKQNA